MLTIAVPVTLCSAGAGLAFSFVIMSRGMESGPLIVILALVGFVVLLILRSALRGAVAAQKDAFHAYRVIVDDEFVRILQADLPESVLLTADLRTVEQGANGVIVLRGEFGTERISKFIKHGEELLDLLRGVMQPQDDESAE